jgi:hypothetical protein
MIKIAALFGWPGEPAQEAFMRLETLANIAEDGPWCGTRPPGPRRFLASSDASRRQFDPQPSPWLRQFGPQPSPWLRQFEPEPSPWFRYAGPQPDPWRLGSIEAGLYGAIRLYQLGQQVTGPVAGGFGSAAEFLFDETCGSVPLSELIWLLLHQPPPPPPPWLETLVFAGDMLVFAQATEQEGLASAAARQILQNLKAFGLEGERARTAE